MSEWLYGKIPNHPFFDQEEKIKCIILQIKSELLKYQIYCIKKFKKYLKISYSLMSFIEKEPLCFDLALKAIKYGVIYWLSRDDAKKHFYYTQKNKNAIDDIAFFLQEHSVSNKIFNYAIHRFILNRRRMIKFSKELIPPLAIASLGYNKFYVRRQDFIEKTPEESFRESKPLYDLHDFSHAVTASLNSDLYGSHYFDSLVDLPSNLRDLIKSHNYKYCLTNPLSDGMVFSELSIYLFNNLNFLALPHINTVSQLSEDLTAYYLGKKFLIHSSTRKSIKVNNPITTFELATLVQNKAYELPASEMEQKLFTRSGNDGDDPLKNLAPSDRIAFLADSTCWLYFEMRNTLRHRAHKEGYKKVAAHLIEVVDNSFERDLLKKIIENIDYADFYKGRRINLWQELQKYVNLRDFTSLINQQSIIGVQAIQLS